MNRLLFNHGSRRLLCAAFVFLGAGALAVGCTEPQSETCSTGIVCPVGSKCSGNGEICIYDDCGDGKKQDGETCDDGNKEDGDGCSANCQSTEGCGDRILNTAVGEICDDGNNEDGDGCSADCRSTEGCGNEIVDAHEMCDDGNNESGDGCREDCLSDEKCGNGVIDYHLDERCDPGLTPDQCSDDCTSNFECGNGIVDVEAGEECDDGDNEDNTDDCTRAPGRLCLRAYCGDGFLRENPESPEDVEECDDGGPSEDCNPDCTPVEQIVDGSPKGCGDGVVNTALGEKCDDGANNGKHGYCNSQCDGPLECGDGIVTLPELCDPNQVPTVFDSSGDPAACRADCAGYEDYCGDGRTTSGEACDNGRANSDTAHNGCTTECQTGPYCGDGIRSGPEECDHSSENLSSTEWKPTESEAQCSMTCSIGPYCGDDILQPIFEECEWEDTFDVDTKDGTRSSSCHEDCSGYCGDGVPNNDGVIDTVSSIDYEGCDKGPHRYDESGTPIGNGADGSDCRADCTMCGDHVVDTAHDETCDAGTANSSTNGRAVQPCRNDCTRCGDGVVQDGENGTANRSEECDEGDGTNLTAGWRRAETCSTSCLVNPYCGDGTTDSPSEACDDGDENLTPGWRRAQTCSTSCVVNPYCGDGIRQPSEQCDSGPYNGIPSFGCNSTCTSSIF